jgi:hypothetical protein
MFNDLFLPLVDRTGYVHHLCLSERTGIISEQARTSQNHNKFEFTGIGTYSIFQA